ncbi:hypothetical protein K438DRAFT_1881974 [Mycena galopus ATCC 62051]|nr:hypothetical protein K438DRAFT_1881974 [Mycena galopus ATCC 62051]
MRGGKAASGRCRTLFLFISHTVTILYFKHCFSIDTPMHSTCYSQIIKSSNTAHHGIEVNDAVARCSYALWPLRPWPFSLACFVAVSAAFCKAFW